MRQRTPWAGLVVGMCTAGQVTLEQAGRSVVLPDGHLTFFHGHTPYRISAPGAHGWLVCRLRFLRIGLDTERVGGLLAGDMTAAGSAGGLLADLLRGSAASRDRLRASGKLHCADAIHSLVRAVIEEAAHPTGPRPVAGLARRWGLDNPAAANRLFRAQYGQPPAAYRKLNSGV